MWYFLEKGFRVPKVVPKNLPAFCIPLVYWEYKFFYFYIENTEQITSKTPNKLPRKCRIICVSHLFLVPLQPQTN